MPISCSLFEEHKVTITKDYVINPNWDEISNSIQIIRLNLIDSNQIDLNKITSSQLLKSFDHDTNFSFITNVKYNGVNYSTRKVFFDKFNGFYWRKLYDRHSNYKQKTIGSLEKDNWYLFEGLSNVKTLYYVYVDVQDSLHTFKVGAHHYTNY